MSDAPRPASKADVFLVSCIDPRFADDTTFRFAALGRTNRYSEMRIAGAALAFVDDRNPAWQATLWENLAATRSLHGIRAVTLLNHRDCGAMDLWAGRRLADDPTEELRIHTEVLNRAAAAIRKRHPDLLIELKVMSADGSVTRPPCQHCIPPGFVAGPPGPDGLPVLRPAGAAPLPAMPTTATAEAPVPTDPRRRMTELARLRSRHGALDAEAETTLVAAAVADGMRADAARAALEAARGDAAGATLAEREVEAWLRSQADAAGRIDAPTLDTAAALYRSRHPGSPDRTASRQAAARIADRAGLVPQPRGLWPFRSTSWFDAARRGQVA